MLRDFVVNENNSLPVQTLEQSFKFKYNTAAIPPFASGEFVDISIPRRVLFSGNLVGGQFNVDNCPSSTVWVLRGDTCDQVQVVRYGRNPANQCSLQSSISTLRGELLDE